jgi:hypothetical protein
MMRLDLAIADTSALLSLVGVLPLEPLDIASIYAPDVSLVEVVAVLRDFHDGRSSDILGDLAVIGPMVTEWVYAHQIAGTLAELAVAHPDQLIADLAAVAAAKVTRLPLVTGQPELAGLDPDVAVVLLRRT